MTASRYSVDQSSSVADLTRLIRALRVRIASYFAACLDQHLDQCFEDERRRSAIHEQGLSRAANAGPAHLGVEHDLLRHGEVGRRVHVDMADAFEMGEDRHPRLFLHARHEALAAARHDDVDSAAEAAEHQPDRLPVDGRHELDRRFRQTGFGERLGQRIADDERGEERVGAAPQDDGIPRFEAEAAGVGGDVRARLRR